MSDACDVCDTVINGRVTQKDQKCYESELSLFWNDKAILWHLWKIKKERFGEIDAGSDLGLLYISGVTFWNGDKVWLQLFGLSSWMK